MPLRDALNLGSGKTSDPTPTSEELIDNITRILADSKPDPDSYDVGAVFTGMVYALRSLESNIAHIESVCTRQRGHITMLENRIANLESGKGSALID